MPKRRLDHTDILILNILQKEGGISNFDLSKRLGIAASTTLVRVNKLKSLGLLPSAHFTLNKDALGYREIFLLKISLRADNQKMQNLEAALLKDGLVEQLWTIAQTEKMGTALYKALVRAKSDVSFAEWCKNLLDKHSCFLESEKVEILIKDRSNLKLKYTDLDTLRNLDENSL